MSDLDFWQDDTLEWKKQGLLTGFLEKKKLFKQMVHPHNSECAFVIVLKFCTMKGTNR